MLKGVRPEGKKNLAGIVRYSEDASAKAGKIEFMYFLLPGMAPVARFTYTLLAPHPDLLKVQAEIRGIQHVPTTTSRRMGEDHPSFVSSAAAASAAATATVRGCGGARARCSR